MKRKDLVVGTDYYHEGSTSDWNAVSRRDITNRTGDHRVRLLGTELYSRNRYATRLRPAYLPATPYAAGTYVRVLRLASRSGHGYRWRQQDEEGYVTLASLRGEWNEVARSTAETLAARDARNREQDDRRERETARLADIATRAHTVGLEVVVPTAGSLNGGRQFTIKEDDLVDFLNALTGTLESLSLVEH